MLGHKELQDVILLLGLPFIIVMAYNYNALSSFLVNFCMYLSAKKNFITTISPFRTNLSRANIFKTATQRNGLNQLTIRMTQQALTESTKMCWTSLRARTLLVVADPAIYEKILQDSHVAEGDISPVKSREGKKNSVEDLEFVAHDSHQQEWAKIRAVYASMLSDVNHYKQVMEKLASWLLHNVKKKNVDLNTLATSYTSSILLAIFFKMEPEKLTSNPELLHKILSLLQKVIHADNTENLKRFLTGKKSNALMHKTLFSNLNTTIAELGIDVKDNRFIELLKQHHLSVSPNVFGIFFAGIDTTAIAITHVIKELDHNENIYRQYSECHGESAKKQFINCLFLETLRLHPPVPFLLRGVERHFTLNGHRIPDGTLVVYSNYEMQRSKQHYGPTSQQFNQNRWYDRDKRDEMLYFLKPFGMGEQKYSAGLGVSSEHFFAPLEFEVFIRTLLDNYLFELTTDKDLILNRAKRRRSAVKPIAVPEITLIKIIDPPYNQPAGM
jgi:cytochrome P450